jgi:hypothetical protein
MSFEETVDAAIMVLQTCLGADLKPTDLEVAVVQTGAPGFKVRLHKQARHQIMRRRERKLGCSTKAYFKNLPSHALVYLRC